jgi:Arm DNA-binding domain
MAASVDIVYRKDKVNAKGESPLHIRITKNRKVRYIATGHKMTADFWDDTRRKVKSNFPNSVRLNHYLNKLKFDFQNDVLNEETKDTTISTKQLKKKITRSSSVEVNCTSQVTAHNEPFKNSIHLLALGAKNYLFEGSHEVAQHRAMLYSLLGTCKLHNLNPSNWLKLYLSSFPLIP